MTTDAIEVRELTKKYGDFIAVNNISFRVERGDIFGFLGHNGAGKTTTVNMLTTLLEPSGGKALIGGFDIQKSSMEVRRIIGYVPENVQLYGNLTAYENLEFFARLSLLEKPAKVIDETLQFLNADSYSRQKLRTLSKGMRQRIGLAQAVLHKPEVLFLDEPTAGLDPKGIKQLRDICIRLNQELNMTIFMNTHLLSEVTKMCKTIGVLNHGRIAYLDSLENTLKRFKNEDSLEQIYLSIETDNHEN